MFPIYGTCKVKFELKGENHKVGRGEREVTPHLVCLNHVPISVYFGVKRVLICTT